MRTSDFISTEEVVAEATDNLNDSDFTHGLGRSTYEMYVHRAIEDLSLNLFFSKITKDIYNWNCNGNGIISIPKNLFNLKELYVFNSSCDSNHTCSNCDNSVSECNCGNCNCGDEITDCCKNKSCWTHFEKAHWKRQFNRFGETGIKTAKISPTRRDPVYLNGISGYIGRGNLVYFGMQNGDICMSDSAFCFRNMRIVANGFGSDNCDLPVIPRELREVCIDICMYKACLKMQLIFPEYRVQRKDIYSNLYGDGNFNNPGSWLKAERFIKSLSSKQREDFQEYFGDITAR